MLKVFKKYYDGLKEMGLVGQSQTAALLCIADAIRSSKEVVENKSNFQFDIEKVNNWIKEQEDNYDPSKDVKPIIRPWIHENFDL